MERVSVKEAASLLGVSQQFVRLGMQRGELPIGSAVKMSTRWTYHIPRECLENYLSGGNLRKDNEKAALRQQDGNHH